MPLKRLHTDYIRNDPGSAAASTSARNFEHTFVPLDVNSAEDARVQSRRKSKVSPEAESDNSIEQGLRLRKKAEPVKSACVQCQKRKTKCSGQRPTCLFCSERDLSCSWDISDGMTRTADLKQKLQDATARSEDLDALVDAMRSGTDEVSTMLLAKLRLGASVEDLVKTLRPEPTMMEAPGSPSELAHSFNALERHEPGTSMTSPDTQNSSASPKQPYQLDRSQLEYVSRNDSRRSGSLSHTVATNQQPFLANNFDQSGMAWQGQGTGLGGGIPGAEERVHGSYNSQQRRGSAPVHRVPLVSGASWASDFAGACQTVPSTSLPAGSESAPTSYTLQGIQGSRQQNLPVRPGQSHQPDQSDSPYANS